MFESRIPKEIHRRIFELTLALYRVTDFFPQGEALRKNLREKANEIFGCISEYGYPENAGREVTTIFAKIQAIRGYLGVARSLRFVKPINITILEREYDILLEFFVKELESLDTQPQEPQHAVSKEDLPTWDEFAEEKPAEAELQKVTTSTSDRQKRILDHLKETKQAKISDFYSFFNDISSKTIQRDLQDLVAKSILRKEGEKRWTTYSLNNVQ